MMKCIRLVNLGLLKHYCNEESLSDEAQINLKAYQPLLISPSILHSFIS